MNEKTNTQIAGTGILEEAIKGAGGSQVVAEACGLLSYQAVNKWIKHGMPRTEYTGETQYALTISRLNGGRYSLGQLLPPKPLRR